MGNPNNCSGHCGHVFNTFRAIEPEGLVVRSRRNFVKASLAGIAGLSVPEVLRLRAESTDTSLSSSKAVILLWMTGGPSHIDTWDMKPDRPLNNRGPFQPISSAIPGVAICEHLPKQAAILDRFSIIRSVDCRQSNHEPNKVMQTGHRDAAPRINRRGEMYPAIGSVVAKYGGANHRSMPPYVAFQTSRSHIAYAGHLGKQYDPFMGNRAAKLPIYDLIGRDTGKMTGADMFRFSRDLNVERIVHRRSLLRQFDALRNDLDKTSEMDALGHYQQQAVDLILGDRARKAFDLSREPKSIVDRYGSHLWCQQALLARRLVEAGVAFVTIDLSYHTASGTWDNHGDNIPPYGGITKGLGPLLPLFDHLLTTLVLDLESHGMLDDVLVMAMGEFGRTPQLGTQGSTDGRNHWPVVMSMCLAGGGFRHGQVIGSTEKDGGAIKSRPVTPGDLAATVYHHMGVPLDSHYLDDQGRPLLVVQENGKPIRELI